MVLQDRWALKTGFTVAFYKEESKVTAFLYSDIALCAAGRTGGMIYYYSSALHHCQIPGSMDRRGELLICAVPSCNSSQSISIEIYSTGIDFAGDVG